MGDELDAGARGVALVVAALRKMTLPSTARAPRDLSSNQCCGGEDQRHVRSPEIITRAARRLCVSTASVRV